MIYQFAISLFAVLIIAAALLGFADPGRLLRLVVAAWRTRAGLYAGAALRVVFGLLLIAAAHTTRYPGAVNFVGFVALVAGLSYPLIGYRRMLNFVHWWRGRTDRFIRIWSLVALLFGLWLLAIVL